MYPQLLSEEEARISRNYDQICSRIGDACRESGRDPHSIRVMAVTKGHGEEAARAARHAGLTLFGENRVMEAREKYVRLRDGISLHLIGHLQRNKAKKAAGFFDCVESIDKLATAQVLEEIYAGYDRSLRIYCEVNTSGEPTKSGFAGREDLFRTLEKILLLPHISVAGLMTVGPLSPDTDTVRRAFMSLKNLYDEIRASWKIHDFTELSMGMSGDYPLAVECGATVVRIGTALFGSRQ
ncbi:MAG: YggS family pyridoxal phosphate-dependent enzyme [Spirochaetaceae bacterium]|nr:MAG: YggS family pyridoxal phosphate-dependent enzyme [Spirochaetaceae bacterium]